jgi:hypothetical protein
MAFFFHTVESYYQIQFESEYLFVSNMQFDLNYVINQQLTNMFVSFTVTASTAVIIIILLSTSLSVSLITPHFHPFYWKYSNFKLFSTIFGEVECHAVRIY